MERSVCLKKDPSSICPPPQDLPVDLTIRSPHQEPNDQQERLASKNVTRCRDSPELSRQPYLATAGMTGDDGPLITPWITGGHLVSQGIARDGQLWLPQTARQSEYNDQFPGKQGRLNVQSDNSDELSKEGGLQNVQVTSHPRVLSQKRKMHSETYNSIKRKRLKCDQATHPTEHSNWNVLLPPSITKSDFSQYQAVLEEQWISLNRIISQQMDSSSLAETHSLLSAMQQSQMLYYTYCTQLFQSLRSQKLLQEKKVPPNNRRQLSSKILTKNDGCDVITSNLPKFPILSIDEATAKQTGTSSLNFHSTCPDVPSASPCATGKVREDEVSSTKQTAHPKKRVPRALTGKHVRHGTGASLTTLKSLRQKLEERRRRKEENGKCPGGGVAKSGISPSKKRR